MGANSATAGQTGQQGGCSKRGRPAAQRACGSAHATALHSSDASAPTLVNVLSSRKVATRRMAEARSGGGSRANRSSMRGLCLVEGILRERKWMRRQRGAAAAGGAWLEQQQAERAAACGEQHEQRSSQEGPRLNIELESSRNEPSSPGRCPCPPCSPAERTQRGGRRVFSGAGDTGGVPAAAGGGGGAHCKAAVQQAESLVELRRNKHSPRCSGESRLPMIAKQRPSSSSTHSSV